LSKYINLSIIIQPQNQSSITRLTKTITISKSSQTESLYEDDDGNSTYNDYQLDDIIIINITSSSSRTVNLLTDFNTYSNSEE
ncbi:17223_t:CDS:1, partial [Funneliformis geosporum]